MPPLFINQLVQAILRNAFDDVVDARVLRAAVLFFRAQRVTVHEESLIVADKETVGGAGDWERSDRLDMALDLPVGRTGLAALAEPMRRWITHLLGISVTIEPLTELRDAPLVWYVGLDAEATRTGDLIWHGREIDEVTMERVAGLFRLTFDNSALALDKVQGEPTLFSPSRLIILSA